MATGGGVSTAGLKGRRADHWTADKRRSTDHHYFTKTVEGDVLITKVSRSGKKTMSPGRFKAILADQRVSERSSGKC